MLTDGLEGTGASEGADMGALSSVGHRTVAVMRHVGDGAAGPSGVQSGVGPLAQERLAGGYNGPRPTSGLPFAATKSLRRH